MKNLPPFRGSTTLDFTLSSFYGGGDRYLGCDYAAPNGTGELYGCGCDAGSGHGNGSSPDGVDMLVENGAGRGHGSGSGAGQGMGICR